MKIVVQNVELKKRKMNNLSEYSLLTEEIGMAIEEREGLSPLSSRIYAMLILSSDEGLHFEDIIEAHQASKSAVSISLKILLKLKYVEYYTKPGERKRYFRTSKYYVKTSMEKFSESFEKEIEVVEKINAFNKKNNPEKYKNEKSVGTLYQEYLLQLRDGFKKKIRQVKTFENQN